MLIIHFYYFVTLFSLAVKQLRKFHFKSDTGMNKMQVYFEHVYLVQQQLVWFISLLLILHTVIFETQFEGKDAL